MASGSFTGTTGNNYIKAKIEWSSTPDTLNNKSSVTATLYYGKTSSATAGTYGTIECYLTIDGSPKYFEQRITLEPNNTWVMVGSHTVTVDHTSDGSKSVSISASGGIPGLTFSSTNCSATVILDKISRATLPTFGASVQTIGSNMRILLNAADSSFHHTVTYSWGSSSGTIATKAQGSITWAIPMDFCTGVPNGTRGTLYVTAETFTSNGVSLGKRTASTSCDVPTSVVPTISAITLTDTGSTVPSTWNVYVQNKSRLHVNVTASGVYYSSIVGYTIEALGVTVSKNDTDIGVINASGEVDVEVTVIDSRGRTAKKTQTITVLEYRDPAITKFNVERTNSAGTPVDNGDYARIELAASGSSVNAKNTITAKIYHMRSDLSSWTLARTISVAYSIDQVVMIGNMVTSRSYAIRVELSDAFGTTIAEGKFNAEGAVMGWKPGGIGVSFGKAAEEDYTADFNWIIHGRKGAKFDAEVSVTGNINASHNIKVGGSLLTRNDYPILHTVDIVTVSRGGSNMQLGSTGSYVKIPFTNFGYNLTGVLKISSGGVLIPAGVRAVKVSAQVCIGAATAGVRYVQLSKNNWDNTVARSQKQHTSTATPETHSIPSTLMTVTEGDLIMVGVYGNNADWVYGIYNQTFLTVEALA